MRRSVFILSLMVLGLMAIVFVAQSATAQSYTLTLNEGRCVQIQAGDGSTPAGTWSMNSDGDPFQGVVTASRSSYSYGVTTLKIATAHVGVISGSDNYFFTACNVCPATGPLSVTLGLPDPTIGGGPRYFDAAAVDDTSDCSHTAIRYPGLDIDIDELARTTGTVAGIVAGVVLFITVFLGLPPSQQPTPQVLPPEQPPAPPRPAQAPPPRPAPAQQPAQRPQLVPTPWIGFGHRVPRDAPQQGAPGSHPPGYPFPPGTWSKMVCPFCLQLTLCPFQDGWFCDNLQCPARRPGTGQTTELVTKQWYSP